MDLFARSGRLAEAEEVVDKMPMKPSRSIWGSIVGACRAHGNMELAERALTELLKLEPDEPGDIFCCPTYMLLREDGAVQTKLGNTWKGGE